MSEHLGCGCHAHPIGIVDAVAASKSRLDKGHRLQPDVGPAPSVSQVYVLVEELTQTQVLGQGGRLDEACVGDHMIIVERHRDAVEAVAR